MQFVAEEKQRGGERAYRGSAQSWHAPAQRNESPLQLALRHNLKIRALAAIVNLLNPLKIMLGGPVPQHAQDLFLEPMLRTLRGRAIRRALLIMEVVFSSLGEESASLGSAVVLGSEILGQDWSNLQHESDNSQSQEPTAPQEEHSHGESDTISAHAMLPG